MFLSRLVRVDRSADIIAKNFSAYCKVKAIISKGQVKIGTTARGLRGVIANKDIGANENIITVPHTAMLSPMDAVRDAGFSSILAKANLPPIVTPATINEKIHGSFIRRSYVALGLYICHVILTNDFEQHEVLKYLDFLPRGESSFAKLNGILTSLLECDEPTVANVAAVALAHSVDANELREMMHWALAMVFSRSMALDHGPTIEKLAAGTSFVADMPPEQTLAFPTMVPLIDMCNHGTDENAGMMVPDAEMQQLRCIVLRSLRTIKKGEEIVTRYGSNNPQELETIYGIDQVR